MAVSRMPLRCGARANQPLGQRIMGSTPPSGSAVASDESCVLRRGAGGGQPTQDAVDYPGDV